MPRCKNKVSVFVARGYHGKLHEYSCGSTGVDGFPVLCPDHAKKFDRQQFRQEMAECGENIDDDY